MAYVDQLDFEEAWNLDSAASRKFIQRWIDKEWTFIQQKEAKILQRLKEGPMIASLEPEWIQQRGYPRTVKAVASGGTTMTFSGYVNGTAITAELLHQIVQTGTILQKRESGVTKQFQITDTNFDDLAVSASVYGNTVWSNDNSGAVDYLILPAPGKDKDAFLYPTALPRDILQTYTTIFKRHVESHFQRRKLAQYAIGDEFLHQVELHMRALKDDIQLACLYDRPYYSAAYKSAMQVEGTTLGGILWWCEYMQTQQANTTTYVDAGGEPLNQTMLDKLGRNLVKTEQANLDRGGYEIWMHGDTFGAVQDFEKDFRRKSAEDKHVGFQVDTITLKEGAEMKILADDIILPDICLMIPTKTIEHGYFQDDTVRRDRVNVDPRFEQWLIHCSKWGMKPDNPRWIGLIYNLGSTV